MKKEEIIIKIKDLVSKKILNLVSDNLDEHSNYYLEINDEIRIHTDIEEKEIGTYKDIVCTKNYIVINKKVYAPNSELRYGFMTNVGLDMFTQTYSYIYDQKERLLYQSFFSDDNKYYGSNNMPLVFNKEALQEYFADTNPIYDKGHLISLPNSMYQPFSNIWQRYGETNVVREYGRDPIQGEYSEIKITFDDDSYKDIHLLCERYGQIFSQGREMKLNNLEEIINEIERIYQESKTSSGFDLDYFWKTFDDTMFVVSKRF